LKLDYVFFSKRQDGSARNTFSGFQKEIVHRIMPLKTQQFWTRHCRQHFAVNDFKGSFRLEWCRAERSKDLSCSVATRWYASLSIH